MSARLAPDYRELAAELSQQRRRGRSLVLTNGCFDLLHVGHVRLLRAAQELGDLLVVALNSDASTRANKGEGRPWIPLAERMEVVAAIEGVDWVTSFDELSAGPLLQTLKPDVHLKGTDWTAETVPEREVVLAYGGRIAIAGDPKTHSSSELIERLRRTPGPATPAGDPRAARCSGR
jgi:rfaE bifunctional protein nucleotidyltransferase chain/domain